MAAYMGHPEFQQIEANGSIFKMGASPKVP